MCFFIVMEIGNSNNPPFTPLDPESGIRDPDPDPGSGSVFFRGLDPDPDPEKIYRIRNTGVLFSIFIIDISFICLSKYLFLT